MPSSPIHNQTKFGCIFWILFIFIIYNVLLVGASTITSSRKTASSTTRGQKISLLGWLREPSSSRNLEPRNAAALTTRSGPANHRTRADNNYNLPLLDSKRYTHENKAVDSSLISLIRDSYAPSSAAYKLSVSSPPGGSGQIDVSVIQTSTSKESQPIVLNQNQYTTLRIGAESYNRILYKITSNFDASMYIDVERFSSTTSSSVPLAESSSFFETALFTKGGMLMFKLNMQHQKYYMLEFANGTKGLSKFTVYGQSAVDPTESQHDIRMNVIAGADVPAGDDTTNVLAFRKESTYSAYDNNFYLLLKCESDFGDIALRYSTLDVQAADIGRNLMSLSSSDEKVLGVSVVAGNTYTFESEKAEYFLSLRYVPRNWEKGTYYERKVITFEAKYTATMFLRVSASSCTQPTCEDYLVISTKTGGGSGDGSGSGAGGAVAGVAGGLAGGALGGGCGLTLLVSGSVLLLFFIIKNRKAIVSFMSKAAPTIGDKDEESDNQSSSSEDEPEQKKFASSQQNVSPEPRGRFVPPPPQQPLPPYSPAPFNNGPWGHNPSPPPGFQPGYGPPPPPGVQPFSPAPVVNHGPWGYHSPPPGVQQHPSTPFNNAQMSNNNGLIGYGGGEI